MADVELVIKIPEKIYNALTHTEFDANLVTDEMRKSIANGTPLPETNAGDLISRQEVSDIIKTRLYQTALNNTECITSYDKVCEDIAENRIDTWVNEAKSVEPEQNLQPTCNQLATDCISRQDVLDLAERGKLVSNGNYKSVCDAINGLPSVEPERKTGKWIWNKRTGTYHCSECGHDPLHEDVGELEEYKYCMNCGAEMEVDG